MRNCSCIMIYCIECTKCELSFYDPVCEDGDLRLVDGNNAREGRVEICYDNVYGTVCDDQWGLLDAAVACRQLGFSDAGIFNAMYSSFTVFNFNRNIRHSSRNAVYILKW